MLNPDILNHTYRLLHDPGYRFGYAYGIDHDAAFDLLPATGGTLKRGDCR